MGYVRRPLQEDPLQRVAFAPPSASSPVSRFMMDRCATVVVVRALETGSLFAKHSRQFNVVALHAIWHPLKKPRCGHGALYPFGAAGGRMQVAGFSTVRESPGPPMISFISPILIEETQPPLDCVTSHDHWFSTWCL